MSFISYIIAWLIIVILFSVVMSAFDKVVFWLREKTPLGRGYREIRENQYKEIASYVVEALNNKNEIKESEGC